jgi:hypothetical protein
VSGNSFHPFDKTVEYLIRLGATQVEWSNIEIPNRIKNLCNRER